MDSEVKNSEGSNKWLVLISIMIGTFMSVLDATVVNTGLPVIMGSLGTSLNKAQWVLTSYMLAIAAVLPAAAWLANRFGFKLIYLLSIGVFTFGSFMCGNSGTIGELIFWRVIEGVGCGSIMPVGMAIITNTFPPNQRGMALGFWAVASAASVSFGPAIGGFLVDTLSWNSIFYVNVPIGIICIFMGMILLREYKLPVNPHFDIPGFLTSSSFLAIFMYGLTEVNSSTNPQGWGSPLVMGCMWLSAVLFILFVYFELTVKNPLLNLSIFRNRNFSIANIMIFIFGIGMFGSTFLVPLYMQDNLGYSALQCGMFFIPVGIVQGIASPLSGMFSQKYNPKIPIALGLILMSSSFYMNTYFSYLTDAWFISLSLILRGLGMGILFTPLMNVALTGLKPQWVAEASSITNIIRQMGGSFGVAILSHVLTNRTIYHEQRYGENIDKTSEAYQQVVKNLSQFGQNNAALNQSVSEQVADQLMMKHLHIEAYISGINDDFLLGFIFTIVCLIPLFWLVNQNKKSTTS